MDWTKQLANRFESTFPETPPFRTVGREAEFPIVHSDGTAGDLADLWTVLIEGGDFQVKKEGEIIVEAAGERFTFSQEVGRGTIELICEPSDDLNGIAATHEAGVERILRAAESVGVYVLGYGIQPLQAPTAQYMCPKVRYGALHEIIGDLWLWFTLTSSDQIHVAIGKHEIVPMANLSNLLSSVTVALCGNSPIYEGADSGLCSVREGRMGEIGAGEGRHGMPLGPVSDMSAYMAQIATHPVLMRWVGDRRVADGRSLTEVLDEAGGASSEEGWRQFLLHDHYIWNSGRPRHAQATIELRAACQQPGDEHMAGAALHLGLVQAGAQLAPWLAQELGDNAWSTMQSYHHAVVKDGLAAAEPFDGFLLGLLNRCAGALESRGRGEEKFLQSLFGRVERGENPAQVVRRVFAADGVEGLVRHTKL